MERAMVKALDSSNPIYSARVGSKSHPDRTTVIYCI